MSEIAEVYRSTGSWYTIKNEKGEFLKARLRGKFKQLDSKLTNPIAVGDFIRYDIDENTYDGEEIANIVDIEKRKNYMIRKSPRKTAHDHVVAANLDLAIVMMSLRSPRTSMGFVDRFLLSAEAYGIPGAIFINKSDLFRPKDADKAEEIQLIYRYLGYEVLIFSLLNGEGTDSIKEVLQGKKALISGHSGTGKTSLINFLLPDQDLKVDTISKFSNKGKHTTTFATCFDINENSKIIDTPGIKEFGITNMEAYEVSRFFPDLKDLAEECKFNTCTHTHEPGCKVVEALENGMISPDRYKSYLSIIADEDFRDN